MAGDEQQISLVEMLILARRVPSRYSTATTTSTYRYYHQHYCHHNRQIDILGSTTHCTLYVHVHARGETRRDETRRDETKREVVLKRKRLRERIRQQEIASPFTN